MLRVLVVDDHAVVRAGLNRIINDAPGMSVGAEAGDAAEALDQLRAGPVDVVVLDLDLPDRSGLELIGDIKRDYPKLPVLILSFHAETACAVPALRAGADGYLMKDSSTGELVEAIEKVMSGGKFVTTSVAEQLATAVGTDANRPRHLALSEREREVFELIGSGLSVSQIAAKLALSVKTISTYRARVLEKMDLHNNAQLIHYAIKHQLVE
jgi:DNA-binding NarL/FixJ family response regulator